MIALANLRCVIPFDNDVIAIGDIGCRMPWALMETAEAGLATKPPGPRFKPAVTVARSTKKMISSGVESFWEQSAKAEYGSNERLLG